MPLRFSLDCPFVCAPTVFSGLSFLVYPYIFLWVVLSKTVGAQKKGQPRKNRKGTQERAIQRKPEGYTRTDNPEKTVGAHKKVQPRENSTGKQERTTQRKS
jgi:hypothetical protein